MTVFARFAISSLVLLFTINAGAQLRLPSVIGSGMVLQQNDSAVLWGWAGPSEKVFVQASWNNQADSAITDNNAQWRLAIKTPAAGGPYTLRFKTWGEEIVLQDVWIGEVWLCSGQSNMEWSFNHGEKDMPAELPHIGNKKIRLFQVPKNTAAYPQDNLPAAWQACDSNTIKSFSAVAYFFGKKLFDSLQVPIGLINASWGGTAAEVWIPEEKMNGDPVLKTVVNTQPAPWWPNLPGRAYNGMIHPLQPFAIAGAIWYQGEGNTGVAHLYNKLFSTLITSWRQEWKKEFPFYYVQIAPFDYGENFKGALLQEAQAKTMRLPNTGMVVVTDLVDSVQNIHPSHKKPVGERLAAWALAETYHYGHAAYKNPVITAIETQKGKLVATVSDAGGPLFIKGKAATGFSLSENGTDWFPATATVKGEHIIISAKNVKAPKHLRYAFGNTIIGNVFGGSQLPLAPYRSDDQPLQ